MIKSDTRYLFILFVILFVESPYLTAQPVPQKDLFWLGDKEFLKYEMHYGIISGGIGTVSLEKTSYNGHPAYHCELIGRTTGFVDWLFNVYDRYVSVFNPQNCLPYLAIRDVSEGPSYTDYNKVTFHQQENKLRSQKSGIKTFKNPLYDIVSAIYYLRKNAFQSLKQNQDLKVETYFCDEPYTLFIRYVGKQKLKTKFGVINCLKFHPVVETGRVFDTEDDLIFWVSDDKNYVPVRIQMNIVLGSFRADLIEYSGLNYSLETTSK